jgi:LacI family transcriptional regulator, kdg operon repressor
VSDLHGISGVSGATIVLDLDNDETLAEIDARIDAAQRQNRRVALFAANAPVALRVALHLKELHGADWQRRVALMSIDDSEWAELAGMTTVRQPTYTIGERAVEFLHERIEGAVVAPRECLLPGELIVRASTSTSALRSVLTNNGGT